MSLVLWNLLGAAPLKVHAPNAFRQRQTDALNWKYFVYTIPNSDSSRLVRRFIHTFVPSRVESRQREPLCGVILIKYKTTFTNFNEIDFINKWPNDCVCVSWVLHHVHATKRTRGDKKTKQKTRATTTSNKTIIHVRCSQLIHLFTDRHLCVNVVLDAYFFVFQSQNWISRMHSRCTCLESIAFYSKKYFFVSFSVIQIRTRGRKNDGTMGQT